MGVLALFSLLISVLWLPSVHDAVGRLLGAEIPPSKTAELAASLLLVGLGLLVGLFLVRRYPAVGGEGWSQAVASWLGLPSLIRSEEHTSELQSLMRISYAVFCLKKKIVHNVTLEDPRHYRVIKAPLTQPLIHIRL